MFVVAPCHATDVQNDGFIKINCEYGDDKAIEAITSTLQEIDRVLPQVPPEEQRYLDAEYDAITSQKKPRDLGTEQILNRRMMHLQSRPLYYVWQVRRELATAQKDVSEIKNPTNPLRFYRSEDANELYRAKSVISPLTRLSVAIDEMAHWLTSADRQLVSAEQFSSFYTKALFMSSHVESFIGCKLARLAQRRDPLDRSH